MPATQFGSVVINGDTPQIFLNGPTGNPVSGDPVSAYRLVSIQAVAQANTDFTVALPLGARIVGIKHLTTTAYTGATATIQVGTSAGGTQIAAAQDIKASADTRIPLAAGAAAPLTGTSAGGSVVYIRLVQGTPTAIGTGVVMIDYLMA